MKSPLVAFPEEGEDLYLGPHEMRKVLHGDRVMVRESGVDRRGRKEGTIVEVIERVNRRVVGRLRGERGFFFVQPAERRISQTILIAPEDVEAFPGILGLPLAAIAVLNHPWIKRPSQQCLWIMQKVLRA